MLRDGELCVCQLTAVLGLAASTVSAHLGELRRAQLIDERKEGRWVFYRVRGEAMAVVPVDSLWAALGVDPLIQRDAAIIRQLRRITPEELCRVELDLQRVGVEAPASPARAHTAGAERP